MTSDEPGICAYCGNEGVLHLHFGDWICLDCKRELDDPSEVVPEFDDTLEELGYD